MGSSPLTRGKLYGSFGLAHAAGIIPAHAGKTTNRGARATGTRDHPRSRGENAIAGAFASRRAGSSPLTRGKRSPRLRCRRPWGSSPLTRGKRGGAAAAGAASGIIPAHAGKTIGNGDSVRERGDHPRSRGENVGSRPPVGSRLGSSPLTRGKPRASIMCTRRHGIIPAHAGKTRAGWGLCRTRRDHPRSRGENEETPLDMDENTGSSPLTRGKPPRNWVVLARGGIIPAHAGKTSWIDSWPKTGRDHPRSRGENRGASPSCTTRVGSSPLTRGKRGKHLAWR